MDLGPPAAFSVSRHRLDLETAWNEVVPGLWIGRYPFRDESSCLETLGVTAVMNLCSEFPGRTGPAHSVFARMPILDATAPSPRQFQAAVDWAVARQAEGKRMLIHCAQGHGRSATITAAILVRVGRAKTAGEALMIVSEARPSAKPSRSQREALARFLSM